MVTCVKEAESAPAPGSPQMDYAELQTLTPSEEGQFSGGNPRH
jgi:hypothetical protein